MDDTNYWGQQYDQKKFASVPEPTKQVAPKDSASYVPATKVPQQTMMSYAPQVDDESEIFKWISKKEEEQMRWFTNWDQGKMMDIYSWILQNKQDKAFLKERKAMLAQAQYAATQSKEDTKNTHIMVKVASYADYIRELAMKEWALWVSKTSDDEILYKAMTTSVLWEQGARDQFSRYLKGEIWADEVDSLIRTGKWLPKEDKESSIVGDVLWWIAKSATASLELWSKIGAFAWRKLLKARWFTDEQIAEFEKTQEWKLFSTKFGENVDKWLSNMWVDTDGVAYKWGKIAGDIAQVVVPTWIETQAANIATKIPKVWKYAKMVVEWALATQKASLVSDKEFASDKEMAAWWALNAVLWVGGEFISKWLKAAWNKLQLSWLINPQKLEYVQKALKDWWDQVDNVTEWMNSRNLVGSKQEIVSKLKTESKKTYDAVRAAIKQADDVVAPIKDDSVWGALDELLTMTSNVKSPQSKQAYNKLLELQQKHMDLWLKPSEIQWVKDSLDEIMNIYTLAWDVKAGVQKADLANLRSNIRGILEDSVQNSVWIDIGVLNRDTAVAYKLAEGIMKKENAASIRELLSPFAPGLLWGWLGWAGGYQIWDTSGEKIQNMIIWVVLWSISWSTRVKTNTGKVLKKLSSTKLWWKWVISGVAASKIQKKDKQQ